MICQLETAPSLVSKLKNALDQPDLLFDEILHLIKDPLVGLLTSFLFGTEQVGGQLKKITLYKMFATKHTGKRLYFLPSPANENINCL